jgi:glycosidase
MTIRTTRNHIGCCLGLALWAAQVFAAAPEVTRIEPPNWWPAHSLNPVRLLISGTNLTHARVESPAGFDTANLHVNANGTFLFVDLRIPTSAAAGAVPLHVVTPDGTTTVTFPLLNPLPRTDRFGGFSPDDVIYLLMPDRFANGDRANDDPPSARGLLDRTKPRHYHGGDLAGIRDHLSYLRELGVTALWTTPWYDNVNHLNQLEKYTADNRRTADGEASTDYHGYGAVDFYGVEERFGDLSQLRELVNAAHAAGLKVIQDQVANHAGPYHPWVTNSPTPTWFNGTVANHLENSWQTWTIAATNPPADKLRSTLDGWFINLLPDLNQDDPETAAYLIQNSLWWIGMTGLDAVRQDTLPYVPRTYWSRWTAALKREYPHLTILGEMWDGNPQLVSFFQGGRARFDGVDSGVETLFDFPLYYAVRDVFAKGQPMTRLAQTLAADTNYVNPRVLVTFLGLHDTARFMSEPGATTTGLKNAFTFLLTTRGTPMIYYGDEIAMAGGGDPDNRRDFPGGWKEDARNAFEIAGRTPEEESVHAHVKQLLQLRQGLSPLRRGDFVELTADANSYVFARVTPEASVIMAFNNSDQPLTLELPLARANLGAAKSLTDRLGKLGTIVVGEGKVKLTLAARSAAVLKP